MSKSPRDWSSACGPNAMLGTVTTLWPSGQVPSRANAIIYVTVSDPVLANLEAFAADEQAKFVDTTPGSSVAPVEGAQTAAGVRRIMVRYHNASRNRDELVAYVEGPAAYYMIVLTAASTDDLETHRTALLEFLEGFIPMARS